MDLPHNERASAERAKLGKVVRRRPRVGPLMAVVMSAVFALVATPLLMVDSLLIHSGAVTFEAGSDAPITLRVPHFTGFAGERFELTGGPVVVAAGEPVDAATAAMAGAVAENMPGGLSAFAAYGAALFLLALMYTTQLRRTHRGRLVRAQAVTLLLLLGVALVFKIVLLLSPMSGFIIPVAGAALVATLVVDMSAGLATALTASVLVGLLVPFELGMVAVFGVQSATAVLLVGERHHKNVHIILAGLLSSLTSVAVYMGFYYLSTSQSPIAELSDPLRSALVATAAGGLLSAVVAIPAVPVYQYLLGDITKNKLVELEDLSNPLLRRIAENAPGTWQHSLAMANMAEIAANAIGANGRLTRVGAYYHDLGKSLQPKYFIENLEPGEQSPHDRLSPEVSCDAIFAHVTEGIRLGRKAGLPERIIDFMHMHHGDGLLEYFWAKCRESGNPKGLTAEDFRYPGVPPQSRETAILAIVDAVEAASRTLKNPDDKSISSLVQRIVYGKLHLGQLDESGLSVADLRKISNSLRETIKHAHHGRIEYPWQREERQESETGEADTRAQPRESDAAARAPEYAGAAGSATQRFLNEPRLDSLDTPRPYWRDPRSQRKPGAPAQRRAIEHAPTERVDHEPPPGRQDPAAEAAPRATASVASVEAAVEAAGTTGVTAAEPREVPAADHDGSREVPAADHDGSPEVPAADHDGSREVPGGVAADEAAEPGPPPPPGSPRRPRSTIELMKDPESDREDGAEDEDQELAPGTLVMGPPPATRPERDVRKSGSVDVPPVAPVTILPRKKRSKPGS